MIERLKYKGHDILRIIDDTNQRRSMQFGVDKAKLLAAHTKEIAEFIADVDKNKAQQAQDATIAGQAKTDDKPAQGKKMFDPFV